jgi:phage baseplate assembly protein gpV
VKSSSVGGTKALTIPRPVASQADAETIAKGVVMRREGEMLRARGEAVPCPALKPGVVLEVGGLGSTWSGKYYCTGVEHVLGRDPLRSYFTVGPSEPDSLVDIFGDGGGHSLQRMLGSMTIGIVTNNKDPESLNRVKVKLPYLSDDLETSWARVLQPGSGSNRGWNVLPEINDEVLVGFEHGDLDRPLVLGGLINGKDKPKYAHVDVLKDGKVFERIFNSRLGHELKFSDVDGEPDKQFLHLKTSKGEATVIVGAKKIEVTAPNLPITLTNSKGSIEIADNGNITLKGEKIVIEAKQDVEIKGLNIKSKSNASTKVEAGATLDLKGTGPTTLESSAITTIKGSLVQIN